MNFVLSSFNVDEDENFPSKTLTLKNETYEIEVVSNPLGLVVAFVDSYDRMYEWYEDGKEWIDEDREVCETPEEWDENFWLVVKQAETFMEELHEKTFDGSPVR